MSHICLSLIIAGFWLACIGYIVEKVDLLFTKELTVDEHITASSHSLRQLLRRYTVSNFSELKIEILFDFMMVNASGLFVFIRSNTIDLSDVQFDNGNNDERPLFSILVHKITMFYSKYWL